MSGTIIIIAVLAILIFYVWFTYNHLATAKVRIKEAFSEIDVQLKRRVDLIPNIVETVKGYAKHEKEIFENIAKAREGLMGAKTPREKAQSNNILTESLKSLFAISENYPDLKASQNFLELQQELSDTENKIAYSRQFYNSTVMDYNTLLARFPSGPLGHMFGFQEEEFFETGEEDRKPVQVKF